MSNNLINVDALDFNGIKQNIKTFLQGQSAFSDYNFEGSALSTLIDVLAYNTHYNALYTNLALNESFIDLASKYLSVVSLAKAIGYTAKSYKSSRARVLVNVDDVINPADVMTLPAGTYFKGTIDDTDYSFYSSDAVTAANISNSERGSYVFDIELIEGTPVTNYYTNIEGVSFVIANPNVDLSTLRVTVRANAQSVDFTTFYKVDDLLSVKGIDNVYFIKQREDGLYEVYFGNDVIGKSLDAGNVVFLDYMVSSGVVTNGCSQFFYAGGFRGDVLYQTTTVSAAIGGADKELIESVKFNAPRSYIAQNRAVTAEDYKIQITSNFPQIESISVWGGQDNVPKKYGVVFISAKPYSRDKLNDQEKKEIQQYLARNSSVMTVMHEFTDPEIIYMSADVLIYYDLKMTSKLVGEIEAISRNNIQQYMNQLNKFNSVFRFLKFLRIIDDTDKSILLNISKITLLKRLKVYFGASYKYVVDFNNPIHISDSSVISSRFYTPAFLNACTLKSDSSGNVNLYTINKDNTLSFEYTTGLIDYSLGRVTIDSLLISALQDLYLSVTVLPKSNDVFSLRNDLLLMTQNDVKVQILKDTETDHIFSALR